MMKIGKYGRTVRLSKLTLESLLPYDSNPDIAVEKMIAMTAKKISESAGSEFTTGAGKPSPIPSAHVCKFDETNLKKIMKEAVEEVILPLAGN
jgi:hypothetical protein